MITKDKITKLAETQLGDGELFIVDITISPSCDIELLIDSDQRVAIDDCVKLSRAINAEFEAQGEEDYSLTVASAGIGYPIKVQRQLKKCEGKMVEVLLKNGQKIAGELLCGATMETVQLRYSVKEPVEGKKRKEMVEKTQTIDFCDIKSLVELLTIK